MIHSKLKSAVIKYLFLTGLTCLMLVGFHLYLNESEPTDKSKQYLTEEERSALDNEIANLWEEYAKIQNKIQQNVKLLTLDHHQKLRLLELSSDNIRSKFENLQQKNEIKYDTSSQPQEQQQHKKETSLEEFAKRRRRVEFACSSRKIEGSVGKVLTHSSGVVYCIVPKAGCTFWKRVFTAVTRHGNATSKSINSIPREFVHIPDASGQPFKPKIHNGTFDTRLIVTRDPYSRLLSSYLDKVYLPDFWRDETSNFVKKLPQDSNIISESDFLRIHFNKMNVLLNRNLTAARISTGTERNCGKFMTFAEFLETALDREEPHWMPIYTICNPCAFNVSHVSYMETFNQDARVVLSKMKIAGVMDDFEDNVNEEIRSISGYNFNHFYRSNRANFYEPCVTPREIAYRLWHNFQWRGYIDPDVKYNIPDFTSRKQVEQDFMRQVWDARNSGLENPAGMKRKKEEFKRLAFSTISRSMFLKISKKYELDFQLFGYTDIRDEMFSLFNNS